MLQLVIALFVVNS